MEIKAHRTKKLSDSDETLQDVSIVNASAGHGRMFESLENAKTHLSRLTKQNHKRTPNAWCRDTSVRLPNRANGFESNPVTTNPLFPTHRPRAIEAVTWQLSEPLSRRVGHQPDGCLCVVGADRGRSGGLDGFQDANVVPAEELNRGRKIDSYMKQSSSLVQGLYLIYL